MISDLPKSVLAGLFVCVAAAGATLSTEAQAVSAQISYGGTTIQQDDQAPGDQLPLPAIVEYEEGISATTPAFADFNRLVLQGSRCTICPSRLSLESEVIFSTTATAASDLVMRVSDINFSLSTLHSWLAETDFTSIIGGVSATYSAYWDPGNVLFATTNLIDSAVLSDTDAYDSNLPVLSPASPFSMTLEVIFSQAALDASNTTLLSTAQERMSAVPLPAGGLLLLGGLGAMAGLRRKTRS